MTLIQFYAEGELAHEALRRGHRFHEEIVSALNIHVASRFPVIGEVTTDAWDKAQGEMHAAGTSLRTCQKVTSHLRGFLDWCERRQKAISLAPRLHAPSNEDVAAEAKVRRAFTRSERDRFLREMKKLDQRAWRIYTTLFYTCLRKSGVEALQPRWLDNPKGYVTIPAGAIKNKTALTLWLHPEARKAIRAEMMRAGKAKGEPVFGPFDFGRVGHHKDAGLFWRAVRAAKISEHELVPHHVTRHTACTIAGDEGASEQELMAMGGWKTAAMVRRYMHEDRERSKRAVERL